VVAMWKLCVRLKKIEYVDCFKMMFLVVAETK
jgi:hypothetical protein